MDKSVLIFSGGGTRFGIYCGMFAALVDQNISPDYIIASCGGSFALSVINAFDTNEQRKAYLQSEEFFSFIQCLHTTDDSKLNRVPQYCLRKLFSSKFAPIVEDVINRYLVDFPQQLYDILPSLCRESAVITHRSIVVGSRLLFSEDSLNSKRQKNEKLYQKLFFTDKETKKIIEAKYQKNIYPSDSAVASAVEVQVGIAMLDAARISIADMFYVSPVYRNGIYYAGGAIDLMPIELASVLGDQVFLQKKKGYTSLENALVKAVFGYDGNIRMQRVIQGVDGVKMFWIDTQDEKEQLKNCYCSKKINWKTWSVEIDKPLSLEIFQQQIQAQWDYGYQKMSKLLEK